MSNTELASQHNRAQDDYWLARQDLASAIRELIETSVTRDIEPDAALKMTESVRAITEELQQSPEMRGLFAYSKTRGGLKTCNAEILCVGGNSHPIAPGLEMWHEDGKWRGRVRFDWSYEGPPGTVHGGWVAAVLDHFMGFCQNFSDFPGMTAGLEVRYRKRTPLDADLELVSWFESEGERKTRVFGEIRHNGKITASAEALFVQPKEGFPMLEAYKNDQFLS